MLSKPLSEIFYFPRRHRHHKLLLILMGIELPFTIVILTLTGIASHDLYQTKLWQDGADNGFNSSPDEVLYAMANYRPYKVPMVWNSFTTSFNLAIGVLSTFFLITKFPVHVLRMFYPPFSVVVHAGLFGLYIASASYQGGSDESDPKHPQSGAPWYIAKNCSVAKDPANIPYCKQAKALFAITIIIIVLYFIELGLSIHGCVLTPEEKEEHRERREEKQIMKDYEDEILKSPAMISPNTNTFPMTPGAHAAPNTAGMAPMTPQSFAFNFNNSPPANGNGPSDLPFRNNDNYQNPSTQQESEETLTSGPQTLSFPPPPKAITK